jgi:hypothetical protein
MAFLPPNELGSALDTGRPTTLHGVRHAGVEKRRRILSYPLRDGQWMTVARS